MGKFASDTGNDDVADCKECSPGTFADKTGQSVCKKCNPGNKCPGNGETQETNCKMGTYQPAQGMKKCIKCPEGTFGQITGAISENTGCVDCKKGT